MFELLWEDYINFDVLSMLVFSVFEEEDYKMVVMMWGMMLKLIFEDNLCCKMVEKSIDMVM